jgi:hypothetical protein
MASLEGRAKISATHKGKKKSAAHKEKISAAMKQYAQSPDCHLNQYHQSGENHVNWKGGIKPEYYRRIAFEAHGEQCQRCDSNRNLNVHHKDRNRRNNAAENLEVLCRSCHNREHKLGGRHGE